MVQNGRNIDVIMSWTGMTMGAVYFDL